MWAELPVLRSDRTRGAVGADTPVTRAQLGAQWGRGAQAHTHTYSCVLKRASGHTPAHTRTQISRAHGCSYLMPLCPNTPAHTDLQVMDVRLSWRDPWSFSFPCKYMSHRKEKENREPEAVCVSPEVGGKPGPGPARGLPSPPAVSQCAWTPRAQGLEEGPCLVWEALEERRAAEPISCLCVPFRGGPLGSQVVQWLKSPPAAQQTQETWV